MGTLHGGVLCDIADAVMGVACRNTLAEDESFTALELKIYFLWSGCSAKLRAKARVVRAGRFVGSLSAMSTTSRSDLSRRLPAPP